MSQPLFRTEVLQARRQRWLGDVVLDQPPTLRVLSFGAVVAAGLVALLLGLGEYTRRTRVPGQLVPDQGVTLVAAPQASVVVRLHAQEGDRVGARQTLAWLAVPHATRADGDSGRSLERTLAQRRLGVAQGFAAQRRQTQGRSQALERQLALLGQEQALLDAELHTRRGQQQLAEQMLARMGPLRGRQYISELQWQQQQTQAMELRAAVQSLARQRQSNLRQVEQLRQEQAQLPDQLMQLDAARERELAALDQEAVAARARTEALVQSPLSGTVGSLLVSVGQPVQAGQPLLSLLPDGSQLQAHLQVPSAAVGFIAPGDTVLMRYAAFPYQRFGHQRGRVLRVSRNALAGTEGSAGEPYYRVVVALEQQGIGVDGRLRPLRPGLALEADILGERRPLWQWALAPLQSLAGRVSGRAEGEKP
jgi:membrane fusion protein